MAISPFTAVLWASLVALCSSSVVGGGNLGERKEKKTRMSLSMVLEKRVTYDSFSLHALGGLDKSQAAHKMAYFGHINVGSPAQTFSVVYDTGSGNLLIPGTECTSTACQHHSMFRKSESSTATRVGCDGSKHADDQLTISFGTGYITGTCMQDQICVENLCTTGKFLTATQESDHPFDAFRFDGVLGLAPDSMAQSSDFSLMALLSRDSLLKEELFSVFLSDRDDETSEITFGEIKSEHMTGDMFWVPVRGSSGYWEVTIEDITLDNVPKSICQDCRVAVDTGTSQLAGPTEIITALSRQLNVRSDCGNYNQLPKLGFVIGGHVLNLSPKDYVEKVEENGVDSCSVSLMSLDVPPPKGPLFVFGIPFLQKFFSVYDHKNMKVGFATAKHKNQEGEALVALDSHHQALTAPSRLRSRVNSVSLLQPGDADSSLL